jgi:hypothetical protein
MRIAVICDRAPVVLHWLGFASLHPRRWCSAGTGSGTRSIPTRRHSRKRLVSGHQLVAQVIAVGDRCYACVGQELRGRAVPASGEFAWLTS